jgi:hypothetical protein
MAVPGPPAEIPTHGETFPPHQPCFLFSICHKLGLFFSVVYPLQ